ncbi:MAG: hypothetical protein JSU63_10660 [Phycisphaerales bacterium]|nr:MAG: hypothetical protein JSU63_10660 [Phycisphaerales bacterium]
MAKECERRTAVLAGLKIVLPSVVVLALIAGCVANGPTQQVAHHRPKKDPERRMRMGPPPHKYIRITGEPVPDWESADMLRGPLGPRSHLVWEPLGPRPILNEFWSGNSDASGRVVSIAPHPTDPDTVYIASASGGIWKTTNGGGLWLPMSDELSILNHGCVAIDPSNPDTIYAGTGEYTTGSTGDGIFRSTDGGLTWTQIATTADVGTTCSRIIVDPDDPQRIHVGGNGGYVRSENGGLSWNVFPPLGSVSDVAMRPDDPSALYLGRHSQGVYRSTDWGDNWTLMTNGLPDTGIRRILLAVTPANPDVVYTAMMDSTGRSLEGVYKSTDGGDSWVKMVNTPDFPYPQAFYDAFIAVDPVNELVVYAGGVYPTYAVAGVIKSIDGGSSWSDITFGATQSPHADQHTMAFGADGTMWLGTDGGVWKSVDDGADWMNTNATLTVTQNYTIALHPSDPAQVMGGTQDNGTVGREAPVEEWPQVQGGDGGFSAYDPSDSLRKYTTYVYLTVYRFYGSSVTEITGPWQVEGDPVNFIAPLAMDPNDPHSLVGGTNRVWRTNNAHSGADWTAISSSFVSGGGRLNAIAVAVGESDTIYTGSSTGQVYVTTDASTWNNRASGLPSGQISDILIDPDDPGTAYVSFYNTTGPRVLRTGAYGTEWTDVTGDLPAGVSARALAIHWLYDPPHLYVGSGAGVYSSVNGGQNWVKDGTDLPNVNIGDLAIDFNEGTITAGTYGRGAWRALAEDCNANGVRDADDLVACPSEDPSCQDCNENGVPDVCDIAVQIVEDVNDNGIPDRCEAAAPLPITAFPSSARKNRYISVDPTSNGPDIVGFQVELVSMKRCSGNLNRACGADSDCQIPAPDEGSCVEHPHTGSVLGWVQQPVQGCSPSHSCGIDDWFATIGPDPWLQSWEGVPTLHIGDCEIVSVATYSLRGSPDGLALGDSMEVGTILKILNEGKYYADVAGPVYDDGGTLRFNEPDGYVNIVDVSAYLLTADSSPPIGHVTWLDLHGGPAGSGNPPQQILNITDLQQILLGDTGVTYKGAGDADHLDPCECPGALCP